MGHPFPTACTRKVISMNTIDISNAVVEKIASAKIREEPFPYIVIKDFLPASLYTRILTEWPPDELFRVTNYKRRRQLYLNRDLSMFPPKNNAANKRIVSARDFHKIALNGLEKRSPSAFAAAPIIRLGILERWRLRVSRKSALPPCSLSSSSVSPHAASAHRRSYHR